MQIDEDQIIALLQFQGDLVAKLGGGGLGGLLGG
jgi:hypothetical protein